jgi:DNA (cytosine-5)-methyltransferase 1
MGRPRLLDLFCGAGGAAMGYHRAGFDVVGVDHKPQPRYPFEFHRADALAFPLDGFDAIHASPPCQAHSALRHLQKGKEYPDLIPETRARLVASGLPYVIENVDGAPLGESGFLIMLCGTMFKLRTPDGRAELRRHRLFEMSLSIALRPACQHGQADRVLTAVGHTPVDNTGRRAVLAVHGDHPHSPAARKQRRRRAISVTGNTPQTNTVRNTVRETFTTDDARAAMGIDWMPMKSLSQAIPPAYTRFIGEHLIAALQETAA